MEQFEERVSLDHITTLFVQSGQNLDNFNKYIVDMKKNPMLLRVIVEINGLVARLANLSDTLLIHEIQKLLKEEVPK